MNASGILAGWRASLAGALALLAGCDREIVLGDSSAPVCLAAGCGGQAPSSAGSGGGGFAGSVAGSPALGGSGPVGVPGCEPSVLDVSCDGIDEACQPTMDDQGCEGTCEGSYVEGSAYMSCLAASDFDGAEARCQQNGMHLVAIDSAAENATVLSLALDDYVWIGGSNRDDADVFVWLDGTAFYASGAPITDTYENFGAGFPNDDPDLRCVQLREIGDGTWSTWHCSGEQSFVCERY